MPIEAFPIDVLFVIALPEEMNGIEPRLPHGTIAQPVGQWTIHSHIERSTPAEAIRLGFWVEHEMGHEEILLHLPSVIRATTPSFLVNVGIAGMMSGDARIGDVVIATDIDYYSYRGAIDEAENLEKALNLGGKPVPCDAKAWKAARTCCERNKELWNSLVRDGDGGKHLSPPDVARLAKTRLINIPIKLHFGPICSGPFVGRSAPFKKRLLSRDRNRLCIEMEAAGIGMVMNEHFPTTGFLVVKGISDPGDKNKRVVDTAFKGKNRLWAVQNAFDMALALVKERFRPVVSVNAQKDIGESTDLDATITEKIIEWFLPQPYRRFADERSGADSSLYEELSAAVSMLPLHEGVSPVAQLASILDDNVSKATIYLSGRPGTGKTTLLSLLYLHCLTAWEQTHRVMPVLIGIRPSIGFWNANNIEVLQEEQLDRITEVLTMVDRLARQDPTISFILLLDSGEAETVFVNEVRSRIREAAKTIPAVALISGRTQHVQFGANPDRHFRLYPRKRDKAVLADFCAAFTRLVHPFEPEHLSRRLQELLWSASLEDIDLFDASMALQLLDAEDERGFRHEATVLEDYSALRLLQLGVQEAAVPAAIDGAARYALAKERGKADSVALEKLLHPQRALARAHPRIHDFLVARVLISDLLACDPSEDIPDSLDSVYAERINRIAKGIMCSADLEERCITNAIGLLGRSDASFRTKAFVTYLIGRAKKAQLKELARTRLVPFIDEARIIQGAASDSIEDHEALLYARTVYITLAYLGDTAVKHEYVALIIKDNRLDGINRGFHLEYFGDQKYEVSLPLQNLDRLEDCPLTVERLFTRLTAEVKSPLFEIELQTFCSLGVQRHAAGTLDSEFAEKLSIVLADEHIREAVKVPELSDFLCTVEFCLAEKHLCAAGIVERFVQERDRPRMGWKLRGIDPCESVADHVVAAVRLAQLYLPAAAAIPGYKKERILQMLWIHDWGESIIGDILPDEKGESEQEREMLVFRQLSNIGMVSGLANQTEALDLYQEFEAKTSINSLIARDIDRLEMLTQVYRYFDQGKLTQEHMKVAKELRDSIRTGPGREILGHINVWRRRREQVDQGQV